MKRSRLIAAIGGAVVAVLAVAVTLVVFSNDNVALPSVIKDTDEEGQKVRMPSNGSELVEIKWKTDEMKKGNEKQSEEASDLKKQTKNDEKKLIEKETD